MKLVIANKNHSSWSLRPWLLLTEFGVPFEEVLIPSRRPSTIPNGSAPSPSSRPAARFLR